MDPPLGPPNCPVAPNGTDPKTNETVMMAKTFRMAFAESWDGAHLSLRGFKSYVGRLPVNPYISFNSSEKVCEKGSRGLLALEDPTIWFDAVSKRYKLLTHQFDCRTSRAWEAVDVRT